MSVSAIDGAGNTGTSTTNTFKFDTTPPSGGAVTVNGVAATTVGSTSSSTSTSFAINSRTDYTDGGSGLASSTLTAQSESFNGTTCGAPGSGGPFTSPTTIAGTTQPGGVTRGFCYLYTLTGTDKAGNTAAISTTVSVSGITFVQNAVAGSAGPSSGSTVETPSLNSPPANGNTLVLLVGDDGNGNATVSTVSGGGVTTWTKVTSVIGSGSPNLGAAEIWYGPRHLLAVHVEQ